MRGIARYKQSRNQTASKAQLVILLYQEALQRLLKAEAGLSEGGLGWLQHVHHSRSIVLELMQGLDDKVAPEFCAQMRALYSWALNELVAVGRDNDPKHLVDVRNVMTTMLEGWTVAVRSPEAARVGK